MSEYWFHLPLNPEPWAVGPLGVARHNSKLTPYIGRNQQLAAYQDAVRECLREEWGDEPPLKGHYDIEFFFWRNRADYTTPAQRQHRKHEADATNLQKATEDAMQGVVIDNDRDVTHVQSYMVEQGPDVVGQVVIHLTSAPERWTFHGEGDFTPEIQRRILLHEAGPARPIEQNIYENAEEIF